MVRKLHAALVGAAVSALAMTAAAPAAAASAIGGTAVQPAGTGSALVATGSTASGLDAITADPAIGRPGGSVDLRTVADCGGTETGSVTSLAFTAPVSLALAADGGLYAQAEVAAGTASGAYQVLELCDGRAVAAGTLQVVGMVAPDTGGGWGATRAVGGTGTVAVAATGTAAGAGTDGLGGVRGRASLALIGAAALGCLARLRRRSHG